MAKRTQITAAKSTSASKSKPQAKKKLVVESSDSEQEQTSNDSSSSSSSSSESSDDESDNNAEKSDTNLEVTGRRKHGGKAATKGRTVTGGKRKRKTHISQVKSTPRDRFKKAGRWLPRHVHPYLDVSLMEQAKQDSLQNDHQPTDEDTDALKAWNLLESICRPLRPLLAGATTPKGLVKLDTAMQTIWRASQSARQRDTNTIRDKILEWLVEDPDDERMEVPLYPNRSKSLRGWENPATRFFLLPQKWQDRSDSESFLSKLDAGEILILATDWPTFLYDQQLVSDDPDSGLFRGYLLFRVFFGIFFGQSSALTGKMLKGSIASKHGMRQVTGRHIAYVAVQTRFALSSVESWDEEDAYFYYPDFYAEIVDFFEADPEDELVIGTLEYWNNQVFGNPHGLDLPVAKKSVLEDMTNSTTAISRAARNARKAARLSSAVTATSTSTATTTATRSAPARASAPVTASTQ